jgi:hypothetical protein
MQVLSTLLLLLKKKIEKENTIKETYSKVLLKIKG